MAFSKLSLFLSLLALAFLLSSNQVHCDEKEDSLRRGIDTYRKSLNLSSLPNNGKASCLADEIANALENHPCTGAGEFAGQKDPTGVVATLVNFPKLLKDCNIDANTTLGGAVLPACVPRPTGDLMIGNYTRSRYVKFLKDSRFTGAGVGSEDDWVVVILTTDKPSGSFSSASSGLAAGFILGLAVCVSHLLL